MTGPFKINGVPLRRVNARYVIATSTKVDLKGVDSKALEKVSGDSYFAREKKSKKEKGEEAFTKQGEKPEVRSYRSPHPTIWRQKSSRTIYANTEFTEEAAHLRACVRPEVDRQAHPLRHQERGIPRQLPLLQLQPAARPETARDEVLSFSSPVHHTPQRPSSSHHETFIHPGKTKSNGAARLECFFLTM